MKHCKIFFTILIILTVIMRTVNVSAIDLDSDYYERVSTYDVYENPDLMFVLRDLRNTSERWYGETYGEKYNNNAEYILADCLNSANRPYLLFVCAPEGSTLEVNFNGIFTSLDNITYAAFRFIPSCTGREDRCVFAWFVYLNENGTVEYRVVSDPSSGESYAWANNQTSFSDFDIDRLLANSVDINAVSSQGVMHFEPLTIDYLTNHGGSGSSWEDVEVDDDMGAIDKILSFLKGVFNNIKNLPQYIWSYFSDNFDTLIVLFRSVLNTLSEITPTNIISKITEVITEISMLPFTIIQGVNNMFYDIFVPQVGFSEIIGMINDKFQFLTELKDIAIDCINAIDTSEEQPQFTVTVYGKTVSIIDFSMFAEYREFIHSLTNVILWYHFIIWAFKYAPKIVEGV